MDSEPGNTVEDSLRDFDQTLDEQARTAILDRLAHIEKQQVRIALMLFVFAMCWAVSKLFPIVMG